MFLDVVLETGLCEDVAITLFDFPLLHQPESSFVPFIFLHLDIGCHRMAAIQNIYLFPPAAVCSGWLGSQKVLWVVLASNFFFFALSL